MAIIISAEMADNLQNRIIDFVRENSFAGWLVDSDGDLTLREEQYFCKAWLRLNTSEEEDTINVGIVSSKKYRMTKKLYAKYHSCFTTLLLSYFDDSIGNIEITPLLHPDIDIVETPS